MRLCETAVLACYLCKFEGDSSPDVVLKGSNITIINVEVGLWEFKNHRT